MTPTPDERAEWIDTLLTLPLAQRWGLYLTEAMRDAGIGPSALVERACAIKPGVFQRSNVTHWRNGVSTAEAERVVVIAKALQLDGIEALRVAGHDHTAQFAADLRANAIEALVKNELEAIEQDDPYLADLDAEHDNHIVTDDEHARLRGDYLRRKRASILRMREDYHDALTGKDEHGSPPAGTNGANAAM